MNKFKYNKYKLITNSVYGFQMLKPKPTIKEIEDFYKTKYFEKAKKRGGHKEGKLICNGVERDTELKWLEETLYKDILEFIENQIIGKSKLIIDVGCGTGDFIKFAEKAGWIVVGIEPSRKAYEKGKKIGLKHLYNTTLEKYIIRGRTKFFDVVILMDILHHVPDPKKILRLCKKLLKPQGIICVRDPNEFNEFQCCAQRKLNKKPWWIIPPEHINYFNFSSEEKLIKSCGFKIIHKTTDFPMELFLLMGDDYVNNSEIGKQCHQKRINFELSIPTELRRNIYNKLAELGLGRSSIIYAKK